MSDRKSKLIHAVLLLLLACPGPVARADSSEAPQQPSLVVIMLEGVRPDVLDEEVAAGHLPNIKQRFYDHGTRFTQSYAPSSLTVPTWSSILTGVDLDRTGIKGDEMFDRQSKTLRNYLDWRPDLITAKYRAHGRAYRQIHHAGNSMILDWFDGDAATVEGGTQSASSGAFFSFFPINDQFPAYLGEDAIGHVVNADIWSETSFQNAVLRMMLDYNFSEALDRYGVDKLLDTIGDNSVPKKPLLGAYLSSPGDLTAIDYLRGRRSLIEVDYQIGRIFQALGQTRYADSEVVLMSDHGFLGGQEGPDDSYDNPLRGQTFALTATNLSYYLAGWYNMPGYSDYNFNVESAYAADGRFSLADFSEVEMNPFQCTDIAREDVKGNQPESCQSYAKNHPDEITAAVMSGGMISLPYARRDSGDWVTPNDWYTLTHYWIGKKSDGTPLIKNLVGDLENFRIPNLAVFSSDLAAKIGNKPLDWLALVVSKADLTRSPQVAAAGVFPDDDAVLIHQSSASEALILHRVDPTAGDLYRYVPIRGFDQASDGTVTFQLNPDTDPLGYIGNAAADRSSTGAAVSDADWFAGYHDARDWVTRYEKTEFPNTVPALFKATSYKGALSKSQARVRVDLFLNPNYGHIFSGWNETNETGFGMWQKEAVQNVFMMTGPGVKQGHEVTVPVFATDIVPTAIHGAKLEGRLAVPYQDLHLDGQVIQDAFE